MVRSYRAMCHSNIRSEVTVRMPCEKFLRIVHHPMETGGFVQTFEDITDQRVAAEKVAHLATHDVLTDLPNRRLLQSQAEALMNSDPAQCLILCIDLDRFKAVNDSLGHGAGDALLVAVTKRLRECSRAGELVCRLGGDEFAILLPATSSEAAAESLAQRIIEELSKPFDLSGTTVVVGASVGIALAPRDGTTPDRLLKSADMALYEAKRSGRGCFRKFEPRFDFLALNRRSMEMSLREAIDKKQFFLHYQPLVRCSDRSIVGFEALIRWNCPTHGLIAPLSFIPLAEELGLIIPISEWVLDEACRAASQWPQHIGLSVNVSARQFVNHDLVGSVKRALEKANLAPNRLELEVTESLIIEADAEVANVLTELRKLGVQVSMDDFGTGYSSLSNLQKFQFKKVKIDRSFVSGLGKDPQCIAIVRAVVALCRSLGIEVTAEGVETSEQEAILRHESCTFLQGYYLGHPRPEIEVPSVIESFSHEEAH